MNRIIRDLADEIRFFIKGSTFDAILIPSIFLLSNRFLSLSTAALLALFAGAVISGIRLAKGQKWQYGLFGMAGTITAALFAFFADNVRSYFLPDIISGSFLFLLCLISVSARKPLAAWLSHLTRGWDRAWYWRDDILPAYLEVTWFWTFILLLRVIALFLVFRYGSTALVFISNIVLGMPFILIVLALSYIYGILRLRRLGGPSIDEYRMQSPPPWEGQRKGF